MPDRDGLEAVATPPPDWAPDSAAQAAENLPAVDNYPPPDSSCPAPALAPRSLPELHWEPLQTASPCPSSRPPHQLARTLLIGQNPGNLTLERNAHPCRVFHSAPPGDGRPETLVQLSVSFYFLQSGHSPVQGRKESAFNWVAHLGAPGVFAIALIDSTIIPLAIPGSTDLLLLWLIANGANPWLLVSCAVAGSLIGGWTTWRLGKKGGQAAIKRYVPARLQDRVRGWSQHHPMLALFLPAVLPPPIPLAPFLLAAGALGATGKRFLGVFGAGRVLRYGLEGWLAVTYGRRITRLWSSTLEKWSAPILWTFLGLTVLGAAFSLWKLLRHRHEADSRAPEPSHGD